MEGCGNLDGNVKEKIEVFNQKVLDVIPDEIEKPLKDIVDKVLDEVPDKIEKPLKDIVDKVLDEIPDELEKPIRDIINNNLDIIPDDIESCIKDLNTDRIRDVIPDEVEKLFEDTFKLPKIIVKNNDDNYLKYQGVRREIIERSEQLEKQSKNIEDIAEKVGCFCFNLLKSKKQ